MVVDAGAEAGSERYGESDYVFCSRACQLRFQRRPERYAGRQAGQRRNARAVQAQEEGPTV